MGNTHFNPDDNQDNGLNCLLMVCRKKNSRNVPGESFHCTLKTEEIWWDSAGTCSELVRQTPFYAKLQASIVFWIE